MKPLKFHLFKNIIIIILLIIIKEYVNSECIKRKITDNECVSECGNELYEFGDYCYDICESYDLEESPFKKCKCPVGKPYIIESDINGLKYYRCINNCPSGYYDVETNICVDKCKGLKNKITKNNGCTDTCGYSQVLFVKTLSNGETMNYCLDECPDEAKFYNPSIFEQIKCITKCSDKYFLIFVVRDKK